MILVYSIEEKIFVEKKVDNLTDPLTQAKGVEFVVSQRYFSWIGPFSPIRKKTVTAYSMITGEPIPVSIWTPEMKEQADIAKASAKGTWKLFIVPIVFFLIFGVLVVYRVIANKVADNDKALQTEYSQNPQVGDILVARVYERDRDTGEDLDRYATIYKITRFDGDTVFVRKSTQKESTDRVYDFSTIVDKFNTSDAIFQPEELKYRIKSLENAHLSSFVDSNKYPNQDLIEIHYRKRIK